MPGILSVLMRRDGDFDGGAGRYGYHSINHLSFGGKWIAYSYESFSFLLRQQGALCFRIFAVDIRLAGSRRHDCLNYNSQVLVER
jgi:hypothetical protein